MRGMILGRKNSVMMITRKRILAEEPEECHRAGVQQSPPPQHCSCPDPLFPVPTLLLFADDSRPSRMTKGAQVSSLTLCNETSAAIGRRRARSWLHPLRKGVFTASAQVIRTLHRLGLRDQTSLVDRQTVARQRPAALFAPGGRDLQVYP